MSSTQGNLRRILLGRSKCTGRPTVQVSCGLQGLYGSGLSHSLASEAPVEDVMPLRYSFATDLLSSLIPKGETTALRETALRKLNCFPGHHQMHQLR